MKAIGTILALIGVICLIVGGAQLVINRNDKNKVTKACIIAIIGAIGIGINWIINNIL
jgi:hypothetical protein